MKKTLTALFALSGTLIFAYITKPSINLPILRARLEKSPRSHGENAGNWGPTSKEFQQPLPFPRNSQASTNKAWHDAIASDVPRQMVQLAAYLPKAKYPNSRESNWKELNEDSNLEGVTQNNAQKSAKDGRYLARYKKNSARKNAEYLTKMRALKSRHSQFPTANSKKALMRAKKQRRQKFPKLSGEKRLLIDWVR